MTVKELSARIGQIAHLRIEDFAFRVKIIDAKTAFGNVRYYVDPVEGSGVKWVSEDRLTFED